MNTLDTTADGVEVNQNVGGKQFSSSCNNQQGEVTPCLRKQNSNPSILSKPKPKVPLKPPVAKKPTSPPSQSGTDRSGEPPPDKRKPPPPLPRTPPKGSGKPPPPKPRTTKLSRENSLQNVSSEKCDNGDQTVETIGTKCRSLGESSENLSEIAHTEKCSTSQAQPEDTSHLAQNLNQDTSQPVNNLNQSEPLSSTVNQPSDISAVNNLGAQNSSSSLQPIEKNSPPKPKVSPKVAPKPRGPKPTQNGVNVTSNSDPIKKKSDDILHDSFNVSLGQSTFYVPNSGKNASLSTNDSNKCELKSSSVKSLKSSGSSASLTTEGAAFKAQPRNKTSSNQKEECVSSSSTSVIERAAHFNVGTSTVHIDHASKPQQKGAKLNKQTTKGEVNNTLSDNVLNDKCERPVPSSFIKGRIPASDTMKNSANSDTNKNKPTADVSFEQQLNENVNNVHEPECAKENSEVVKLRPKPQKRSPGKPRPLPRKRSSLCKQSGLDVEDGQVSEISPSETSSMANSVESIPNVVNDSSESLPADGDLGKNLSGSTDTASVSSCVRIDKGMSPGDSVNNASSSSQNLQEPKFCAKDSQSFTHEQSGKLSSNLCNMKENSEGCDREKQQISTMTENTSGNRPQNLSAKTSVIHEPSNSNADPLCESVSSYNQRFVASDEPPIVETSSLLDEMERIISRRMSELGSQFSTDTALHGSQSERSSLDFPIPPTRHKKNRLRSQSTQFLTRSLDASDFGGSNLSISSDSGIIIPPAVSKRICPPKPKRNKLANRSVSDVGCLRSRPLQSKGEIDVDFVDESSSVKGTKEVPPTVPRRQRSITVDFCVPANQHALLREIALADHKKGLTNQESSSRDQSLERRKPRPTRKAPPPPKKVNNVTSNTSDKKDIQGKVRVEKDQVVPNINERVINPNKTDYDGISSDEHDHEYLEIPESFIHQHILNSSASPEGSSVLSSGDQTLPVPPELPPRNSMSPQSSIDTASPRLSGISPLASEVSSSTSDLHNKHDRPLSRVSTNSVLSSNSENESMCQFENNELSTSESEDEDLEDKVARKKEKKVFYIAREIWSSEKVFVSVLKLLCEDFRTHILESKDPNGKPVIQEEVLNKILNYLPQLYNLNQVLLQDLEGRINNWDKCKQIADIFVKKGAFLKLYTSYIRDFSETNEIFDEACKRHPPFQNAVRTFEMSPVCASLTMKHYMLKPIQRIPQYQLLLQDYLKNLPRESPDYNDTLAALNIVREVADHANESMKQGDQVQKMLEIQKSLDGNFEVIKPGRVLLKEGELMKLSRKEMQPRMFFLFNDVLLYTTPTTSGGYRLNNALTLNGMKIIKASLDEFKSEFDIITVTRSFTVEARTIKERDEWVIALQSAISENAQRKKTFDTRVDNQSIYNIDYELGSKAPIWIPDTRVTMCMICTCEFSVTWRRHHCRACGRVLCSNCSDNKAPLEYLRNKPARVCDECYSQLKAAIEGKRRSSSLTDSVTHDTDGSLLSLGNLLERFQQIRKSARFTPKFNIRRPARLKEVHANDTGSSISGYLKILKGKKWKKFWFVLKDKVLYTYKASNDMAAVESMPVVGYVVGSLNQVHEGCKPSVLFQLIHKNRPAIIFQAEDEEANKRWIASMEDASKA